ncbi:hypothetical protein VE03_04598 [Pseudogymnoascus sp. 23342-1-I1]|nr:hypothetical protein VE03_04598 [Pseudogymnoascus sp. 23342-1-I1]
MPPSPPPLQILTPPPPPTTPKPKTLFILDSSFNPPTTAHLHLARSALFSEDEARYPHPRRVLLLLATKNADKPDVEAGREDRVTMMKVLAGDVAAGDRVAAGEGKEGRRAENELRAGEGVDIALTPHALFIDKARVIAEEPTYSSAKKVFILGFDTLKRLLEVRYYEPPTLAGLGALFEGGVRVHLRAGSEEEEGEQRRWIESLGGEGGELERNGGRREWVRGLELLGARGEEVSSSEVRRRVKAGEAVAGLATEGVVEVIEREDLYRVG